MSTIDSNHGLLQDTRAGRRLGELLTATVRYIPLLTALLTLGLLGVYGLAQAHILGQPSPQLLMAAGVSLGVGLAHLGINTLVRQGRTWIALCVFWVLLGVWSVSIVLLWEAVTPVAVVMAFVAFLVVLAGGVRGRWLLGTGAASLAVALGLIWLNGHPSGGRLTTANPAGLAAIVLLGSTAILFILGTIVVRLFRYQSVQSRLVTAMALIMAVPVIFTTAISAVTATTNSQVQLRDTLQAMSSLRRLQIDTIVQSIAEEMSPLQQGLNRGRPILHTLNPGAATISVYEAE